MDIKITDIHPFVRYAQHLYVSELSNFKGQRAYENRLFYIKSGKGIIRIEGKEHRLSEGDIIIWGPGMLYDLDPSMGDFSLLGLNFDYLWDRHDLDIPIFPGKTDFNPKNIIENVRFTDNEILNEPIVLKGFFSAADDLMNILEEYRQSKILSAAINSSIARSLILRIFRQAMSRSSDKVLKTEEILKYINRNCSKNLSNESLASVFGYHPNYLNHIIVSQTGISLHKYILKCRIMRAIDLLQTTDLPANQIAAMSGFGDYNHFLKYFKKITGKTTKDFR